MDFTCFSASQITECLAGWAAARQREPFDKNATPIWQEGYRLYQHHHRGSTECRPSATIN